MTQPAEMKMSGSVGTCLADRRIILLFITRADLLGSHSVRPGILEDEDILGIDYRT